MTLAEYLMVTAMVLFVDALLCHALKRRFRLFFCVPAALIWPITMPITIIGCAYLTRNMPKAGA